MVYKFLLRTHTLTFNLALCICTLVEYIQVQSLLNNSSGISCDGKTSSCQQFGDTDMTGTLEGQIILGKGY